MNAQKTAYWLALAAFGFGLQNAYQSGELPLLQRVKARAGSEMCRLASHAEQTFATARLIAAGFNLVGSSGEFTAPERNEAVRSEVAQAEVPRVRVGRAEVNRAEVDRAGIDDMVAMRQAEMTRAVALRQADLARIQQRLARVRVVVDGAELKNLRGLQEIHSRLAEVSNPKVLAICTKSGARFAVNTNVVVDVPKVDVSDVDVPDADANVSVDIQ